MPTRLMSYGLAWIIGAAAISVAATQTSELFGDEQTTTLYDRKETFYEQSGFGGLAVMPNVTSRRDARIEYEYIALPDPGRYRLARRNLRSPSDWWFVFNHRLGDQPAEPHSFVGVLIAKRLRTRPVNSLELFRNANWSVSNPDTPFRALFESSAEFFELQDSEAILESFEQEFGIWHARPDPNGEFSWRHRGYWLDPRVGECFRSVGSRETRHVLFEARLLRFQPTNGTNTQFPVVWNIRTGNTDALFVRTFSPRGADVGGEYCVEIA
ncbi:MAG: hypothetical protein OXP36_12890 [Gammaproteobacteria bacterium]|nr:hypothetical protein [Gammaproteobacteria bacterium]